MRERLTITIKKDLLKKLDNKIDGVKIRNRSHAFEYFLNKSLGSKVDTALILAGGKGSDMRPFTYEIPKSMIPVGNRPILENTINLLREHNIRNIYIAIDYLGDKIRQYFSDGSKFGVKIKYILDEKPQGTAGALKSSKKYLKDKKFVLLHSDILVDIDITDMIDFAEEEKTPLTMALTSIDDPSLYGSVRLRGAKIVEFSEKPHVDNSTSRLVNAGVYVANPEIFNYLPNKIPASLEKTVFPKLLKDIKLSGYHFAGPWFDVSTPQNYDRAIKSWKRIRKSRQ